MSTTDERVVMLQAQERTFAESLASQVIERPSVSVWMILVPILFVHYMYRHSRYVAGRKQFIDHYLVSRSNALQEAAAAYAEGRQPEVSRIASLNGLSSDVQPLLEEFLQELIKHYLALLRADGEDLVSLIRSAYGSGTAYLLVMNRLNAAERRLYDALSRRLEGQQEDLNSIVVKMEVESERLRREEAARIFS